jgi:hypothetical protein
VIFFNPALFLPQILRGTCQLHTRLLSGGKNIESQGFSGRDAWAFRQIRDMFLPNWSFKRPAEIKTDV